MPIKGLDKFLTNLLKNDFFAPRREGKNVFVRKINNVSEIDWSGDMPVNSFKSIFYPSREELFSMQNGQVKEIKLKNAKTIIWGMNILDLQAFTLFEHVFRKDESFQSRRRNIYIIGYTNGLPEDYRKYKVFHENYEENVLEHVIFDVFVERKKDGCFVIFSGSEKGQSLLEENGIKDYENIQFAGLVPEKGMDSRIVANRQAVENSADDKMWQELGEICLACGKCSIACPTCYCFDFNDEPELDGVKKVRTWGNCYYPEFSKTSGGFKELNSVAKKLYFWYSHKFVRIPEELSYYGCVSCMRCFKACPVGINIVKNLQKLKKIGIKN